MKERDIERKLVVETVRRRGVALKFVSPGCIGVPDRIVMLPDGKMGFVELKAPGKKPRPIQVRRIQQMRKMGFKVFVIDGVEQIGSVLDAIGE
ncbi:VRR-NUC domain-containing protein [Selenomonas sp. WCA-380-WT-3B 3/]|uniref:VRR-NUC domain-containing protein n=1 Tax=Selenomonas montiformis TaxID=2652285 RepID=A0A6I2UWR7_9FIRM|nr:VRR-NUC domain-containing protein [Selenomonas montiformis]MSV23722.1 VRR-NUC domain-containing protein [Selenomonas montiformis]